jgi:hypothetical protein
MNNQQLPSGPATPQSPSDDGYLGKLGIATALGVGTGLAVSAIGGIPLLGFVLAAKVTTSSLNALNKSKEGEVKK